MRYIEAIKKAHLLYTPDLTCNNVDCYILPHHELRPMRVDDKPGIHFLKCPLCGKIFHRPITPEQENTQSPQRKTPPPPPPPKRAQPVKKDEAIDLPNLFTV